MNICASTLQQIVNLGLSCFPLSMLVSGVGGNLVAVQASRISTYLHMNGLPMGDPNPTPRKCPTPCTSFFGSCKYTGGMECSTVSLLVSLREHSHLYLVAALCDFFLNYYSNL